MNCGYSTLHWNCITSLSLWDGKKFWRMVVLVMLPTDDDSDDDENTTATTTTLSNTMLLPCQVIYKNAIKSIPNSLSLRLRFVETCRMFPRTRELERIIIQSIERDFGNSEEAWVSRISFAEEQMKKKCSAKKTIGGVSDESEDVEGRGFLALPSDGNDDDEEEEEPVTKKRRLIVKDNALELVNEALETVPTSTMYLECARYLQLRIQRLVNSATSNRDSDDDDEDQTQDVSYLIRDHEDVESAVKRHSNLLKEIYSKAEANNVHSTNLTLDQVDFLSSNNEMEEAYQLLAGAIKRGDCNSTLFIRWANLSDDMTTNGLSPELTPAAILRKGLEATPIHDRDAFLSLSTELMKQLMSQPPSTKFTKELKSIFEKLLLTSQGVTKPNINGSDEADGVKVNLADTFLAYLEYTIPSKIGTCTTADNAAVRSIYNGVIFHSSYAKSCLDKSNDELFAIKSFFDVCLNFEKSIAAVPDGMTNKSSAKKQKKQMLSRLYEGAIAFFGSGIKDSALRSVVDSYQRELDNIKFGI